MDECRLAFDEGETIPKVSFAKGMWYPIEKSGQIGGFVQYMIYDIVSVHKFPRCSKNTS